MLEEHVLNMPNGLLMKFFHRVYLIEEQVEMVENVDFHTVMDLLDAKMKILLNEIRENEKIHTSRTVRISSKPYFVS